MSSTVVIILLAAGCLMLAVAALLKFTEPDGLLIRVCLKYGYTDAELAGRYGLAPGAVPGTPAGSVAGGMPLTAQVIPRGTVTRPCGRPPWEQERRPRHGKGGAS